MAKQTINIGTVANDGTGSNLRVGGTIINDNFTELYTALGTGSAITLTATPTQLNLLVGVSSLSLNIRDDASSAISITPGGTLKLKSNDGITTTVSQGDTITIGLDSNVVTETSTDTLTNKTLTLPVISTISNSGTITLPTGTHTLVARDTTDTLTNKSIAAGTNTISGLTNTNLSGSAGITNANLAKSFIRITDETSTVGTVNLGDRLDFLTGNGIDTVVSGNTVRISTSAIPNASLSNSTITLGSTSTSLGGTTSSVADLSLTGSANTIDLTSSGNKLRFNFANTGSFPNSTTYQGQFAVATGTAKAYFADAGAYNEIITENSSIKDLSDVAGTSPTNNQVLIFNSTTGRYEPGNQTGGGTLTSIVAGTGLSGGTITTTGTIAIDTTAPFQTSATIDVTDSGGFYRFSSHYTGTQSPTLYLRPGHTYAFNLNVTGHPFFLQTIPNPSGSYPVTYSAGNQYTTGLTHVATDGTVTTGAAALPKSTGVLYVEVPSNSNTKIYYACTNHAYMGNVIVLGSVTDTFTGDGSTTTQTINNGRNVNDILVIVNGIILVPTTDYTVTTSNNYNVGTLTFITAPAASAEIQVRYL